MGGIEPPYKSFADSRRTTWRHGRKNFKVGIPTSLYYIYKMCIATDYRLTTPPHLCVGVGACLATRPSPNFYHKITHPPHFDQELNFKYNGVVNLPRLPRRSA